MTAWLAFAGVPQSPVCEHLNRATGVLVASASGGAFALVWGRRAAQILQARGPELSCNPAAFSPSDGRRDHPLIVRLSSPLLGGYPSPFFPVQRDEKSPPPVRYLCMLKKKKRPGLGLHGDGGHHVFFDSPPPCRPPPPSSALGPVGLRGAGLVGILG